jgi:hypothetical protein
MWYHLFQTLYKKYWHIYWFLDDAINTPNVSRRVVHWTPHIYCYDPELVLSIVNTHGFEIQGEWCESLTGTCPRLQGEWCESLTGTCPRLQGEWCESLTGTCPRLQGEWCDCCAWLWSSPSFMQNSCPLWVKLGINERLVTVGEVNEKVICWANRYVAPLLSGEYCA